jgi:WD40 repeat protein/mono/diheme cytochrome c family protein
MPAMSQPILLLSSLLLGAALALADEPKLAKPGDAQVSYFRQVRPILQRHCQGCHQPAKRLGKLDLTTYATFKQGGDNGDCFVPGKPDESVLFDFITGSPPKMPKNGLGIPLSNEQVELIRRWVAEGARDDTPAQAGGAISPSAPPVYQRPPVISALAFSPDGQTLAVSGYHEILLHKPDGSGLICRLVGVSPRIESLAFSPDGNLLGAACGSPGLFGEIQLWDMAKARLKHSVTVSNDTLYGLAFSPDGQKVAFGAADNAARVLNVADGKIALRIDHHQDWVLGAAFAFTAKAATENRQQAQGARENVALKMQEGILHLITIGRDRALKLTEADTGSFVDDINKLLDGLRCLALHPKGEWIACGGDDGVPRLYQIFRTKPRVMMDDDLNLVRAFERQPGPISVMSFSPDGALLAIGSVAGGEVHLYETESTKRIATLAGHEGGIFALAWLPDGKTLATGGHDGQVRLFALPDGKLVKSFVPVPLK